MSLRMCVPLVLFSLFTDQSSSNFLHFPSSSRLSIFSLYSCVLACAFSTRSWCSRGFFSFQFCLFGCSCGGDMRESLWLLMRNSRMRDSPSKCVSGTLHVERHLSASLGRPLVIWVTRKCLITYLRGVIIFVCHCPLSPSCKMINTCSRVSFSNTFISSILGRWYVQLGHLALLYFRRF